MKQRQKAIPPAVAQRIPEALERLLKLYDAQGNQEKAAVWKEQLQQLKSSR